MHSVQGAKIGKRIKVKRAQANEAFDFQKYDVKIITVEHNFTMNRDRICGLLESRGFCRLFEKISMWDDWYRKS